MCWSLAELQNVICYMEQIFDQIFAQIYPFQLWSSELFTSPLSCLARFIVLWDIRNLSIINCEQIQTRFWDAMVQNWTCSCDKVGGTGEGRRDSRGMAKTRNRSEPELFSSSLAPRSPRCRRASLTGNLDNPQSTRKSSKCQTNYLFTPSKYQNW